MQAADARQPRQFAHDHHARLDDFLQSYWVSLGKSQKTRALFDRILAYVGDMGKFEIRHFQKCNRKDFVTFLRATNEECWAESFEDVS